MKQIIYILTLLISISGLQAQDSTSLFSIPIKNWELKIIDREHLYPIYLADPLDVKWELSVRNMKYSDIDQEDKVNQNGSYYYLAHLMEDVDAL